MGEATRAISIEDVGRACGMERVSVIDPYNLENTRHVIRRGIVGKRAISDRLARALPPAGEEEESGRCERS